MKILRNILAVLAALAVGNIVITLFESITSMQHPYPEGMRKDNMDEIKAFIATLPPSAFILVFLGHITGSFVAGLIAWLISKSSYIPSMVAGALFMIAGLINLLIIDHPWWMWLEMLLYLPAAYFGARLLRK
jgi:fructose-specific phosphotransferase system IIC component